MCDEILHESSKTMYSHVAVHTDALILVNKVQQRVPGCRKINKLRMGKGPKWAASVSHEAPNWSRDLRTDGL
jgi:hypothetical protein